jgi:hypothetical protein
MTPNQRKFIKGTLDNVFEYMMKGTKTDPNLKEQRTKKMWEILEEIVKSPRFAQYIGDDDKAKLIKLAVEKRSTTASAISSAISSGNASSIAETVVVSEITSKAPRFGKIMGTIIPIATKAAKGSTPAQIAVSEVMRRISGPIASYAYGKYKTYRNKQKVIEAIKSAPLRVNIVRRSDRNKQLPNGYVQLFDYFSNPTINGITNKNVINYMYKHYKGNWSKIKTSKLSLKNKQAIARMVNRTEENMWRDMGAR